VSESIRATKTKVEAVSLASILVATALDVIFWDQFGARLSLGLIILLPSSIMLGYYIADKAAPDRLYSIGLYTFLIAIALIVAGLNYKLTVSTFLIIISIIIIISVFTSEREEQEPR